MKPPIVPISLRKVDGCSRNILSFLSLREKLSQKSVTFILLDIPTSSDLADNNIIVMHIVCIATFENERRQ